MNKTSIEIVFAIMFSLLISSTRRMTIATSIRTIKPLLRLQNTVNYCRLQPLCSSHGSGYGADDDRVSSPIDDPLLREEDLEQLRDIDLILSERAQRFGDGATAREKESCVLLAVDSRQLQRKSAPNSHTEFEYFSFEESLSELSELVGTAGLRVVGTCIQRLVAPNSNSYINTGKAVDLVRVANSTGARTIVVDDDLSAKQQRNLENLCAECGGEDLKILDRTAVILEIFAQHAQSKEGQLQVELAQLEYRQTRGPRARGDVNSDSGCGFRGPGESRLETDRRVIRDKILRVKREIEALGDQRQHHRRTRARLGVPVIALVGYTNAGKSTLMNRLSRAGVLAENMLFATLDPTTRKINLPKVVKAASSIATSSANSKTTASTQSNLNTLDLQSLTAFSQDDTASLTATRLTTVTQGHTSEAEDSEELEEYTLAKGQEVFLTDTVGFISKLPADLVAAFRATLEEVRGADVLIHVIDRSSPAWRKQRSTVLRELAALDCNHIPVIELWNKLDMIPTRNRRLVVEEARRSPVQVEADILSGVEGSDPEHLNEIKGTEDNTPTSRRFLPLTTTSRAVSLPSQLSSPDTIAAQDMKRSLSGGRPQHQQRAQIPAEDYFWSGDDQYISDTSPLSSSSSSVVDDAKSINQPMVYTVAASAKTGRGIPDLLSALETALSLRQRPVTLFVPFAEDTGVTARLLSQASVQQVEYTSEGTLMRLRLPEEKLHLYQAFTVDDDALVTDEGSDSASTYNTAVDFEQRYR